MAKQAMSSQIETKPPKLDPELLEYMRWLDSSTITCDKHDKVTQLIENASIMRANHKTGQSCLKMRQDQPTSLSRKVTNFVTQE